MTIKDIENENNYVYVPADMKEYYRALYKSLNGIRNRLVAIRGIKMDQVRYGKDHIAGEGIMKSFTFNFFWLGPFQYKKEVEIKVHSRELPDCDRAFRIIIHFNDFAYSIRNEEDLDDAIESITNSLNQ